MFAYAPSWVDNGVLLPALPGVAMSYGGPEDEDDYDLDDEDWPEDEDDGKWDEDDYED